VRRTRGRQPAPDTARRGAEALYVLDAARVFLRQVIDDHGQGVMIPAEDVLRILGGVLSPAPGPAGDPRADPLTGCLPVLPEPPGQP
jgi:hypothetical protein